MIPRSAFSWSLLKLLLLHYFGFDWQRRPVHIVHICRPEWSRCSYHTWPIHVFVSCVVTVFLEYQEIVSTTNFQFWIMSSRFRHQDFGNQFHQTSCMSTQHTPGYSGMSPAFCFFAPWVPFFEKEQSLWLFIAKRAKPETFRIPIPHCCSVTSHFFPKRAKPDCKKSILVPYHVLQFSTTFYPRDEGRPLSCSAGHVALCWHYFCSAVRQLQFFRNASFFCDCFIVHKLFFLRMDLPSRTGSACFFTGVACVWIARQDAIRWLHGSLFTNVPTGIL